MLTTKAYWVLHRAKLPCPKGNKLQAHLEFQGVPGSDDIVLPYLNRCYICREVWFSSATLSLAPLGHLMKCTGRLKQDLRNKSFY